MKKKILVVYYTMHVGGSTTSLLSFLKALDKAKYDVDLLLYKNEGEFLKNVPDEISVLPEAFCYNSLTGKIIKILKGIFCGYMIQALKANRKLGVKGLSEQIMADFQALCLSRKISTRYNYAVGYMEGWSDRYVAYCVKADKKYCWLHSTFRNIAPVPELEKKWMKDTDHIVCVADSCRIDFCKSMPEFASKCLTIENLFDSDFIRKQASIIDVDDVVLKEFISKKVFKIVSVCRLAIKTKGLDRIVACAKKLKELRKDFVWYIVGDGADKKNMEEMICEAKLKDQIILTGKRNNPYPFLVNADIMCMPSRWEGKPMTVAEAMILGTPCVVTEYLSAREQIRDGIDGIIVENNDISIQDAVLQCIDNKNFLKDLKNNLREHKYGNEKYIKYIESTLFS